MSNTLGSIMEAVLNDKGQTEELGKRVGKLYTDFGLPIDMSLERLNLGSQQTLAVLHYALGWIVQHKRNSGATEAAIDRTRKNNRAVMERFLAKGEAGVY